MRDDVHGSVYLPQPDGSFNLHEAGVSSYASLTVEGPSALQPTPRASLPPARSSLGAAGTASLSSTAGPSTSTQASSTPFRSVIAPKRSPSFNLKIIKAKMIKNGRKVNFKPVHQTFIELVETTANACGPYTWRGAEKVGYKFYTCDSRWVKIGRCTRDSRYMSHVYSYSYNCKLHSLF